MARGAGLATRPRSAMGWPDMRAVAAFSSCAPSSRPAAPPVPSAGPASAAALLEHQPKQPKLAEAAACAAGALVGKRNILGLDVEQLGELFLAAGLKKYRALQVFQGVYRFGHRSFDDILSLSKADRELLAQRFTVDYGTLSPPTVSADGTRKWLVTFADAQKVEMVFIPEGARGTLCISSQVGCSLRCTFCHTGTQPLMRNLSSADIVGQIMLARHALGDFEHVHARASHPPSMPGLAGATPAAAAAGGNSRC